MEVGKAKKKYGICIRIPILSLSFPNNKNEENINSHCIAVRNKRYNLCKVPSIW